MDITRATIMAIMASIMDIMANIITKDRDITLGKLRASMEVVRPLLFTETEEILVLDSALALGQGCLL